MANKIPPDPRGRGASMFMLLLLLLLIAALVAWAFLRNPPDTPSPSGTAAPATVPGGTPAS
jgi:hypothetical protein